MIKIGIVGTRERDGAKDYAKVLEALTEVIKESKCPLEEITIVSGGCPEGGDRFAEEIAKRFTIKTIIHYPDKSKLETMTRWAYSKMFYGRNTLIAQDSDILIACVSPDRKGGTEDTISKYLRMGKDKLIIV